MSNQLKTDVLYVIDSPTGEMMYARTPDGVGCYWYDETAEDEAYGDVCPVVSVVHFDSHDEFEAFREGEWYD